MKAPVVHVLGSFEIGGAEQVALNIAAAQVERGYTVHVVALTGGEEGPHARGFRAAGVHTHTIAKTLRGVDVLLVARLTRFFKRLSPLVVHTHNPLPLIYAGPATRLARVRWVHTKHGYNAASERRVKLAKLAGRFADVFVAVSEQTARDARRRGDCRPERLRVVLNGIDLAQYSPNSELRQTVRSELGIPQAVWVIGSVARMSEVKNQILLARAALPLLGDKVRLVMVGDGPQRPLIEQLIAHSEKRSFVHILGRRLDVPRLLPSFDTFALTSKSEGLPMVLPEAMASGLPLVCTNVGGVSEVVDDGKTGWLVESGDEARLSDRLAWLSEHPEQARAFGDKGREVALAKYSLNTMVDAYLELYRKLDV